MKLVPLATLALLGLGAAAAPARADDVRIDYGFGFGFGFGARDHDRRDGRFRGHVEIGYEAHERFAPRPRFEPVPLPTPVPFSPPEPVRELGRHVFIPAHLERRTETVCDPAVYEDVRVPVYETRHMPTFQAILDHHGHVIRVQIGDRHERVQVGVRIERVLVRAETCREIATEIWVPGRYVRVFPRGFDRTRVAPRPDLVGAGRFDVSGSGARREHIHPRPPGGYVPVEGEAMDEDEVARALRDATPRHPRR